MNLSWLVFVLKKKLRLAATFTRAHERLSCSFPAEVLFIERGCTIRGVVDEVSRGGVRLRPGATYILKRMGEDVDVHVSFDRFHLGATLVNTSPGGYGFKLKRLLTAEELEEITAAA